MVCSPPLTVTEVSSLEVVHLFLAFSGKARKSTPKKQGIFLSAEPLNMERKKPIKKNHIKEFGGRDAPETSQGQTRDVPGTPGTFGPDLCVNQY